MNNHTASVLLFVAVFGSSILMNTPATPRTTAVYNQYDQPLGRGIIKVDTVADAHIAIPDSANTPAPNTSVSTQISTSTPKTFREVVTTNMLKVRAIAQEFGHHETMQAILLQESNGGTGKPVGNPSASVRNRSYGLMQVQIVAARSILSRYPSISNEYFPGKLVSSITDKEIVSLLLHNDEANIRIAVQHFDLYLTLSKGNWTKAVAAYNMGIGNANKTTSFANNHYVRSIKTHIQTTVKPFNRTNSLTL